MSEVVFCGVAGGELRISGLQDPDAWSEHPMIELRKIGVEALTLWDWMNSPREAQFDDFGPETLKSFTVEVQQRTARWIYLNGETVGYLGYALLNPVCLQFRGLVIDPKKRRQGIGQTAIELAVKQFSKLGVKTFISMPFSDNAPIKELLLKAGFHFTGYIPGATMQNGEPVSTSIFCLEVK